MEATGSSMTGEVCMIKGCNSGIGKVTARELAGMGSTVVMVVCEGLVRNEGLSTGSLCDGFFLFPKSLNRKRP